MMRCLAGALRRVDCFFSTVDAGPLGETPSAGILRRSWTEQYHRDGQGVRRREGEDLPPARERHPAHQGVSSY
ncbi:hypothetical protein [Streptomyces sp. AF1A]|uniref:hypothetical protein n=1 Tax=Streptomyces sp. AF1A TaxID=3394350 RepID=UPI0039BD8702